MEKIILDVDTGLDDMVALLFALGSSQLDVRLIVATSGNQVLAHTLPNTVNVVSYLGKQVPVYAGSHGPLMRKQVTGGHIHGTDGLGDIPFPSYGTKAEKGYGVMAIIGEVLAHPGEITLVPTGPLTDIALAYRIEPRMEECVKNIVFMGGSLRSGGNITPKAEFNFFADPEAARIVLATKTPKVMLGLDATLQVLLDDERLDSFRKKKGKAAQLFVKGMDFYTETCKRIIRECPAMHDPCCIAYLLAPQLFQGERKDITVCTTEGDAYGMVIDNGTEGTTNVILKVNADGFWPLLEKSLEMLG